MTPIGNIRKAIRERNTYRPKVDATRKVLDMGGGVTRSVPIAGDEFISTGRQNNG